MNLVAQVSASLFNRIKAPDVLKKALDVLGGKGGGRPDMAQGAGERPELIHEALVAVEQDLIGIL